MPKHAGQSRPSPDIRLFRVRWENLAGDSAEMAVHAESPADAAWRAALKLQGRIELLVFISADEITAAERGEIDA